jgi:hypothetical protein
MIPATMKGLQPRLVGVELYFDDLNKAQDFYANTLGLRLGDAAANHHARFDTPTAFVCLEKRGVENYLSANKAVLFIEVAIFAAQWMRWDPTKLSNTKRPQTALGPFFTTRKVTTSCCCKPTQRTKR